MKFFYFKHKLFFAVMESRIYWKVQACMYGRRKVQKLKGEGTAVLDSLSLGLGHKCSAVYRSLKLLKKVSLVEQYKIDC